MLRSSLLQNDGANVEQVEIDFPADLPADRVLPAWTATVRHTAALRHAFVIHDGEPRGIAPVGNRSARSN